MIDNPSDQFELYLHEVLETVCSITGRDGIKDFKDVVELAKVAAVNILVDTIKHSLEELHD